MVAQWMMNVCGSGAVAEWAKGREGRPFGDGADVTVVPGGRTVVAPQRPPQLALPDGFAPLVELRVHAGVGADAVRRVVPQP